MLRGSMLVHVFGLSLIEHTNLTFHHRFNHILNLKIRVELNF